MGNLERGGFDVQGALAAVAAPAPLAMATGGLGMDGNGGGLRTT
jgi:hypothetical protein